MIKEPLTYSNGKQTFKGFIAKGKETTHLNLSSFLLTLGKFRSFAKTKAEYSPNWGYIGFAIDYYGDGITAQSNERASELMTPLFLIEKNFSRG